MKGVLSHYQNVSHIGAGGMEAVYRAHDERLARDLGPIPSLKVISRTSVMRFKNSKEALRSIAHTLDVDAIVEGSVLCWQSSAHHRADHRGFDRPPCRGVRALSPRAVCVEYLVRAYEKRSGDMLYLRVEPYFDPIRSDSRFQALPSRVDEGIAANP